VRATVQVLDPTDHLEIDLAEACSALDHYAVAPLTKAVYCFYSFDLVGLAEHCTVGAHSTVRLLPAGHFDCMADRLLLLGLATTDSAGLTRSSVD